MKYLMILITLISLTSCQMVVNLATDIDGANKVRDHQLYYLPEFETLDTPVKIGSWIKEHVTYDAKRDDIGTWNNPVATLSLGYGTCADYAILFLNIAHFGMHQDGDFIMCKSPYNRSIEAGGDVGHAMVRIGGQIIEPQSGLFKQVEVGYSYSFSEVFN